MTNLLRVLNHHGFVPRTVFDIGVAYGTPWLYEAFPKAKFHLIDPTRESLPHMQRWATLLDADIHNVALGDHEGLAEIRVRPEIGGSSLFEEVGDAEISGVYEVPVTRFDQLFPCAGHGRPALAKIDVQGAELGVLSGMGDNLEHLDMLIVETSLIATLRGDAPEVVDVLGFLGDRGFVLYDIVGAMRRPLDRSLAVIDAVFVQSNSPLRVDRRWGN
jgi:FkbM family methyltransferase